MLKFIYNKKGFDLELVSESLETWITHRVMFSLRAGISIAVEPKTASFLLRADLPNLQELVAQLQSESQTIFELSIADTDYWEFTLQGALIYSNCKGDKGIFITSNSDRFEAILFQLAQVAQEYAALADYNSSSD